MENVLTDLMAIAFQRERPSETDKTMHLAFLDESFRYAARLAWRIKSAGEASSSVMRSKSPFSGICGKENIGYCQQFVPTFSLCFSMKVRLEIDHSMKAGKSLSGALESNPNKKVSKFNLAKAALRKCTTGTSTYAIHLHNGTIEKAILLIRRTSCAITHLTQQDRSWNS